METNIIKEYLGESFYEFLVFAKFLWLLISPYAYAFLTSTTMLLFKVARRKPDENGIISEFSFKYLFKDRGAFIIATGLAIVLFTTLSVTYFPKTDAIIIGIFIGAGSSYLGLLLELIGKAGFNFGKKQINRINEGGN